MRNRHNARRRERAIRFSARFTEPIDPCCFGRSAEDGDDIDAPLCDACRTSIDALDLPFPPRLVVSADTAPRDFDERQHLPDAPDWWPTPMERLQEVFDERAEAYFERMENDVISMFAGLSVPSAPGARR